MGKSLLCQDLQRHQPPLWFGDRGKRVGVGVQAALRLYPDLPGYGLVFFLVLPCSYLDRLAYCRSEGWQFKNLYVFRS